MVYTAIESVDSVRNARDHIEEDNGNGNLQTVLNYDVDIILLIKIFLGQLCFKSLSTVSADHDECDNNEYSLCPHVGSNPSFSEN